MDFPINALVLLPFLILLNFNCFLFTAQAEKCIYTVLLKTSDVQNAGTDAKVSLKFFNTQFDFVTVDNLENWGTMSSGHDYFEQGNMDVFQGTGDCINYCGIILKSDNSGNKPGWHVSYLDITTYASSNNHANNHQRFDISQWLALDENPHELTTIRHHCGKVSLPANLF